MITEEKLAAQERRRKEDQQFRENLIEEIAHKYNFCCPIAKVCVNKGWEDGHAYGYNEVRTQSQIAADFAQKIFAIIGAG